MTAGNRTQLNDPIKSLSTLVIESICLADIQMDWNRSLMKFYRPHLPANGSVHYLQPAEQLISCVCRHYSSHPHLCYPHTLFWMGQTRHPSGSNSLLELFICLQRQTNGRISYLYSRPKEAARQEAGQNQRCSLPKWLHHQLPGLWPHLQLRSRHLKAILTDF